jgi:hypothetical protein
LLSLNASGQIFLQAQFADLWGKRDLPPADRLHQPSWGRSLPSRVLCFIAAALSASTGVTAPDRVDRLEARRAFLLAEPDAQREAVVAEPGAPREAVAVVGPAAQPEAAADPDAAVVAVPDAQLEAAAAPDAQQGVAVAAVPDAQRAAVVVAASDAQQAAVEAAVSDAQQGPAVAVVSDAQRAAVLAPMVEAVKLRVRPLVASVEPAETAAVRLWFRATMVSAAALERRVVSAAKAQAAADR